MTKENSILKTFGFPEFEKGQLDVNQLEFLVGAYSKMLNSQLEGFENQDSKAREGIIYHDLSNNILYANPAMATMLGYKSPQELLKTSSSIKDFLIKADVGSSTIIGLDSLSPLFVHKHVNGKNEQKILRMYSTLISVMNSDLKAILPVKKPGVLGGKWSPFGNYDYVVQKSKLIRVICEDITDVVKTAKERSDVRKRSQERGFNSVEKIFRSMNEDNKSLLDNYGIKSFDHLVYFYLTNHSLLHDIRNKASFLGVPDVLKKKYSRGDKMISKEVILEDLKILKSYMSPFEEFIEGKKSLKPKSLSEIVKGYRAGFDGLLQSYARSELSDKKQINISINTRINNVSVKVDSGIYDVLDNLIGNSIRAIHNNFKQRTSGRIVITDELLTSTRKNEFKDYFSKFNIDFDTSRNYVALKISDTGTGIVDENLLKDFMQGIRHSTKSDDGHEHGWGAVSVNLFTRVNGGYLMARNKHGDPSSTVTKGLDTYLILPVDEI